MFWSKSLLQKILGLAADETTAPGEPGVVCAALAPGETLHVAGMTFSNEDGGIAWWLPAPAGPARRLRCRVEPSGRLTIAGLGPREDEGLCLSPGRRGRWAVVAQVRPERAPEFDRLLPGVDPAPVCRFGPGGGFVHDWPPAGVVAGSREPVASSQEKQAEPDTGIGSQLATGSRLRATTDDQAAGLRAAVASTNGRAAR